MLASGGHGSPEARYCAARSPPVLRINPTTDQITLVASHQALDRSRVQASTMTPRHETRSVMVSPRPEESPITDTTIARSSMTFPTPLDPGSGIFTGGWESSACG